MDKPADPATPLAEVYQALFDDLAIHSTKPSTIARYCYNIVRFERWLVETGRPSTLASSDQRLLFAYRQHLETLPQQPRGSTRRRRGGLMSRHTVDSYLRRVRQRALRDLVAAVPTTAYFASSGGAGGRQEQSSNPSSPANTTTR